MRWLYRDQRSYLLVRILDVLGSDLGHPFFEKEDFEFETKVFLLQVTDCLPSG